MVPQSANILLVDDERIIRELIREVLESDGARIVEAANLAEARAAIAADRFDVAIVDKNLPDGSGIELIRELRGPERNTEVILITGYPSLDSAIEVLQIGVFDYSAIPSDLGEYDIAGLSNGGVAVFGKRGADPRLKHTWQWALPLLIVWGFILFMV